MTIEHSTRATKGVRQVAVLQRGISALIVASAIAGSCCLPTVGIASTRVQGYGMVTAASTSKGNASGSKNASGSQKANKESPANYGTSPQTIAQGGREAHAHGKTYRVTSDGTGIECVADGSKSSQVLYQNKDMGIKDAWGSKYHPGFPIYCLHVTDDSLVFVEYQNDGSSEFYYDIIQTNLDGTGRKELHRGLGPSGYGTRQWTNRAFMWLDRGFIFFIDNGTIWRQSLNATGKKRVADLGRYDTWSVDEGVVYCSVDGGKSFVSYDPYRGTASKAVADAEVPSFMREWHSQKSKS